MVQNANNSFGQHCVTLESSSLVIKCKQTLKSYCNPWNLAKLSSALHLSHSMEILDAFLSWNCAANGMGRCACPTIGQLQKIKGLLRRTEGKQRKTLPSFTSFQQEPTSVSFVLASCAFVLACFTLILAGCASILVCCAFVLALFCSGHLRFCSGLFLFAC